MSKFNKSVISVFRLSLLALVAVLMLSGSALAQAQGEMPDFKAITKDQPPFTENELKLFINDYPKVQNMQEEEGINYLMSQGWTAPRFFYVVLKVGMCHEILNRGGGNDAINQLPQELRPQKGELDLVKKHKAELDAFKKKQ